MVKEKNFFLYLHKKFGTDYDQGSVNSLLGLQ